MEDQRTPLPVDPQEESFLSLLTKIQSKRMEDQRASLHLEATINPSPRIASARVESVQSEDEFIDLLFRCQVCLNSVYICVYIHLYNNVWRDQYVKQEVYTGLCIIDRKSDPITKQLIPYQSFMYMYTVLHNIYYH